jgi:hypothetical protein
MKKTDGISEKTAQKLNEILTHTSKEIKDFSKSLRESSIRILTEKRKRWVNVVVVTELEVKKQDEILKTLESKINKAKWYNRWYYSHKCKKELDKWLKLIGRLALANIEINHIDKLLKEEENKTDV